MKKEKKREDDFDILDTEIVIFVSMSKLLEISFMTSLEGPFELFQPHFWLFCGKKRGPFCSHFFVPFLLPVALYYFLICFAIS